MRYFIELLKRYFFGGYFLRKSRVLRKSRLVSPLNKMRKNAFLRRMEELDKRNVEKFDFPSFQYVSFCFWGEFDGENSSVAVCVVMKHAPLSFCKGALVRLRSVLVNIPAFKENGAAAVLEFVDDSDVLPDLLGTHRERLLGVRWVLRLNGVSPRQLSLIDKELSSAPAYYRGKPISVDFV